MPKIIINLTQHSATPAQIAEGVVDLPTELRTKLTELLTFDTIPSETVVFQRAQAIADMAEAWLGNQPRPEDYGRDGAVLEEAMIGGAPYLMCALEYALLNYEIAPVYAFSVRESVEQTQPDGSVRKVAVFKHAGFVRMFEEAPTE